MRTSPLRFLFALLCFSWRALSNDAHFLKRKKVTHVSDPAIVDGKFVQSIVRASGDSLVLLYSPTCPDCQWLVEKVWRKVAAKLDEDSSISVMTVADPGYAAPKPFEHWNNPAILLAAKNDKLNPVFFPQSRLAEYLKGLPVKIRSQEQQDSDMLQDILAFAKGAQGVRLWQEAVVANRSRGLQNVESLAAQEWLALQKKWAGANDYPAPPRAVVMPDGAKSSRATLMASKNVKLTRTHDADSAQLDPDQLWVLGMSQQSAKLEKAEAWTLDYARKVVHEHPGQGYTIEGVFKYALPYYQSRAQNEAS